MFVKNKSMGGMPVIYGFLMIMCMLVPR